MKKINSLFLAIIEFALVIMIPFTAYANSSWYWISTVRPFDILPVAAVLTIIIELVIIKYMGRVDSTGKLLAVVIFANLLSFAMPYLCRCFDTLYSFDQMIENTPSYTVTLVFLLMTLIVEMPIVYCFTRKISENKKYLLLSIFVSNTITTVLVAVIERMICRGSW
ncbi:MAG: hypothetical protein NC397_01195 [Clostridium sp.]|nr:hypothetical protein [Clostridium sp.]